MDTVISFTPAQLWAGLLGLCAAIVSIGGAVAMIVKAKRATQAPVKRLEERLTALESRLARHDEYLAKDKTRLEVLEEGRRVELRALLALLSHGLDGNAVEAMQKAKEDLQQHLIER